MELTVQMVPFYAQIISSKGSCGATIISAYFAITAAHCVHEHKR